ncbi:hypothetical protein D3C80_1099380 [compost metagenome]
MQVIGHVAKGRVGAQAFGQALGPQVEFGAVIALEYILILAAAGAGTEVDVLSGPQVQDDARYLRHFRPQLVDELADRDIAFAAILEGDPETAVGDGLVVAGHPHGVGKGAHGWVGFEDPGQGLVFFQHVRVGNVGRCFCGPEHEAGVLHREKALGYGHVAGHGQYDCHSENTQHQALMGQRPNQAVVIPGQQALAECRALSGGMFRVVHELRTEHWRQRQRYHDGDQDGRGRREGEFLEQPADHAPHEQ